jgi:hypothetical protein
VLTNSTSSTGSTTSPGITSSISGRSSTHDSSLLHRHSPEIIHKISAYANDLYDVISSGYHCECPLPHEVGLALRRVSFGDIDVNEPFQLLFSNNERTTTQISGQVQILPNSQVNKSAELIEKEDCFVLR